MRPNRATLTRSQRPCAWTGGGRARCRHRWARLWHQIRLVGLASRIVPLLGCAAQDRQLVCQAPVELIKAERAQPDGVDPATIAVYCTLKLDKNYPPGPMIAFNSFTPV
jgi:hypothetical protein